MSPETKKQLIKKYIENKDQSKVPSEVNKLLCENCTICCEHVSLEIDAPEDKEDYENILWYLLHENVLVFIDEKDWFIEFKTRCKALTPDGLCRIHDKRPGVCRDYSQDSCELHGKGDDPYDTVFRSPEEFIIYVREKTEFKDFGFEIKKDL